MNEILCAGSIGLDTTRTPFGSAVDALGGAAVYFSFSASFFAPVHMVSVAGSDLPAAQWKLMQTRPGLDVSGVKIVPGAKTFSYESEFSYDMYVRKTIRTDHNVMADFDPVVPEAARGVSHVYLATMQPEIQSRVLDQTTRAGLVFMDTIEYYLAHNRPALEKLLGRVDGIVINDVEARELSGQSSLLKAGKLIQEKGPAIVIIKKGEHGSLLFYGGAVYPFPAYPLEEVVDPTGAGDSFAGGLVGNLAKSGITRNNLSPDSLRTAMAYATVMGSFAVEDFSLRRLAVIDRQDIGDRLEEYRRLLRF